MQKRATFTGRARRRKTDPWVRAGDAVARGLITVGGIGTIVGTLFGILTIGVLENGMVLVGADFHTQRVLIGALLIGAVAYQGYRHRQRGALEV